jgi:pilus assembly protein CpaC
MKLPPKRITQGSVAVSNQRFLSGHRSVLVAALFVSLSQLASIAGAQPRQTYPLQIKVSESSQRLEMVVNTSKILTLEKKVPRVFVSDTTVVQASPLSPNQIQISAIKPGVTQVNMWDEDGTIYTVDVIATRDASELIELLKSEFPEATIRVRPLAESVYITGYVPRPEMVDEIISLARDYYSNVINGITVGGVQQVALHVKVMEVSRTKLRQFGLDWIFTGESFEIIQAVGQIAGTETIQFSIFGDASEFIGYLDALRQDDLVKLLAEPTLVTMTGRPASFNSGGSFPILVPNGLGTVGIEFKQYGTRVDFVPIVLGNGNIRLEVRPSVSELDDSRGVLVDGVNVPGITDRTVETSVEMKAGQTLALAGLIQNRIEAQKRGIPLLGDLPWLGRAFSRVEERMNEVELLVVVTPELVGPLDPHQVPQCGPGQYTASPNDHELYGCGYLEVPNCCLFGNGPYTEHTHPPIHHSPESVTAPYAPVDGGLQDTAPQSATIETDDEAAAEVQHASPLISEARPAVIERPSEYLPASHRSRTHSDTRAPGPYGPLGYDPLD